MYKNTGLRPWPSAIPRGSGKEGVLRDFEGVAFSGLEPDQYSWSAILHVDQDGTKHVHVFIARVELRSGKAFNVADRKSVV